MGQDNALNESETPWAIEELASVFGPLQSVISVPDIHADHPGLNQYRELGFDICQILGWLNDLDAICRRNRHQILASFPALIPTLATRGTASESVIREIGAVVDRGNPLIDSISRLTGVSRTTLRTVMGLEPRILGSAWLGNALQWLLACSLASQVLPKSEGEWKFFQDYWVLSGLAGDYYYQTGSLPVRFRSLFREHIFRLLCRNGYSKSSLNRLERLTNGNLQQIRFIGDYVDFVDYWIWHRWPDVRERSQLAAEELLMRYPLGELIRQSILWHDLISQETEQLYSAENSELESPFDSWPGLLQEPFDFGDLYAVSLTSAGDLREEGRRLEHCVGSYVHACATGTSHIISLRNIAGNSVSTAELVLYQQRQDNWTGSVVQHFGNRNYLPPKECEVLLAQVLRQLEKPVVQPWLHKVQAIHDERRELLEYREWVAQEHRAANGQRILSQILPDFENAVRWLDSRSLEPDER